MNILRLLDLGPLTTVGNLVSVTTYSDYLIACSQLRFQPFRRLCVSLGADITCGESECLWHTMYTFPRMLKRLLVGLATSFLSGSKEEWSLVRRHPSETMFGVQIAGSKPATLVPAAEVITRESVGGIDFMDLNCGCPIDLVFRTGSGSARTFFVVSVLKNSDRHPIRSAGCCRKTGKNPDRYEPGPRRDTSNHQDADGCQRRS
jgi:hypothetical protein